MAELQINLGDVEAAEACAMEAKALTPHAYQVIFLGGILLHKKLKSL